MGLLSWLFPSAEDRIAKARRFLADGRHADARLEILDLEHPEAQAILTEAEHELARVNIEHAVSWAEAGDEQRVALHLELAENFHRGGLEPEFRAARRRVRELRAERSHEERRKREEEQARLLSVDPFGLSGGGDLFRPPLPDDIAGEDAEELAARLDLLLENYPEALRGTVGDLGADFARAVLDLDDGRADLALQTLLALDEDQPLVCWETARAAHALGDPAAAARTLRRFSSLAGRDYDMGRQHTGVFLAQLHAEAGDTEQALAVLREVRREEPDLGGFLFAQLLFARGKLKDAEDVVLSLLKRNGRVQAFYALLAQIRLKGGHRVEAMTALERALDRTCEVPGRCGTQPPDPAIVRQLATLYLEDGLEPERALELADQARRIARKPTWDNLYLEALVAQHLASPEAPSLAAQAWSHLEGPDDPRRPRLERHLPLPTGDAALG